MKDFFVGKHGVITSCVTRNLTGTSINCDGFYEAFHSLCSHDIHLKSAYKVYNKLLILTHSPTRFLQTGIFKYFRIKLI